MGKQLKFGSKITHKGSKYFVTNVGIRVIKARKILNISARDPNGQVSNYISTIKVKDLK